MSDISQSHKHCFLVRSFSSYTEFQVKAQTFSLSLTFRYFSGMHSSKVLLSSAGTDLLKRGVGILKEPSPRLHQNWLSYLRKFSPGVIAFKWFLEKSVVHDLEGSRKMLGRRKWFKNIYILHRFTSHPSLLPPTSPLSPPLPHPHLATSALSSSLFLFLSAPPHPSPPPPPFLSFCLPQTEWGRRTSSRERGATALGTVSAPAAAPDVSEPRLRICRAVE